jgi:hypothetical protein
VTVQIVDSDGPVADVSVNGSWNVNNSQGYSTSSGTTGPDGMVNLSTGMIRNASTFEFCVTTLSASGYVDGSNGECSPSGSPWTSGDPADPGVNPPTGLTAATVKKGRNWRAELTWTDGGVTVDVLLNGSVIATVSNSGAYTDNLGKTPSGTFTYQVCDSGSTAACSGTDGFSF